MNKIATGALCALLLVVGLPACHPSRNAPIDVVSQSPHPSGGGPGTAGNHRPLVTDGAPTLAVVGRTWSWRPRASDADGQALTWRPGFVPAGFQVDGRTGRATWQPPASMVGRVGVRLLVSDGIDTVDVDFPISVVEEPPTGQGTRGGLGLTFDRLSRTAAAGDAVPFRVTGGRAPYWIGVAGWRDLESHGGSRPAVDVGSFDSSTGQGTYRVGTRDGTSDRLWVVDLDGRIATMVVDVAAATPPPPPPPASLAFDPARVDARTGQRVEFRIVGGRAPFRFHARSAADLGSHGGSVPPGTFGFDESSRRGFWVVGPTGGTTDTFYVRDAAGAEARIVITVGGGSPVPPPTGSLALPTSGPGGGTGGAGGAVGLAHDATFDYVVYVPRGIDPRRPVPVIAAFHGLGDTADNFSRACGIGVGGIWQRICDREKAIFVAFQAHGPNRGWYFPDARVIGPIGPQSYDRVLAALVDLATRHNLDARRVFAFGYSNGAAFANSAALLHPELFASFVSCGAGLGSYISTTPDRKVAGSWRGDPADPNFNPLAYLARDGARSAGHEVAFKEMPGIGHSFLQNAGYYNPQGAEEVWAFFASHPIP